MPTFFTTFLGKSLLTFLIAMLPVVELRGAIPVGVAMGIDVRYCFALAVVGNILPVPFIVVFIRRILAWLQKRSKFMDKIIQKRIEHTMNRRKAVYSSELIGLLLFVAIPLPGTGAWTGALLAALLEMRLKSAFPVIAVGVVIAGVVIMSVTYGVTTIAF
jgi:uncharacterized membrane protein